MKTLLTVVLMAASSLVSAEPAQLRVRPDGTPDMVIHKAEMLPHPVKDASLQGALERLKLEMAATALPFLFDYSVEPAKLQLIDVAPATKELTSVSLPARLDTTQRIADLYWKFNQRMFYTSTAFDRANKVYFAFFTGKAGEEVCEPEGGRLLKSSIPVDLDAQTHYVISLQINIFDPEKSTLKYTPARGFQGQNNSVRADKAMQYIHNAGVVIPFSKGPLTFYYATDVDGATKKMAATRTISFVKENGRDTKYYTIPDENLPKDKWVSADLGGQAALLFRGQDDSLKIAEPN